MASSRISALAAVAVLVLVAAAAIREAEGQTTPSCGESLVPCANSLNSTNPPSTCCEPLKEAITNQLACLCNIYTTPGLLKSLGINITEALLLPSRCKIQGDLNSCVKASGPSSSSSVPPPATPGKDAAGVSRIVATWMLSILLFSASMMLC